MHMLSILDTISMGVTLTTLLWGVSSFWDAAMPSEAHLVQFL